MGKNKWMSKSSSRKGCNLRAPVTARRQGGGSVLQVHWTPVFARGKLRIFMCDPALAADPQHPQKLNDSENLSKFVKNYLPGVLQEMKDEFGWSTLPRAVVHDKASYMASTGHNRLHVVFAAGLKSGGFSSWIGNDAANAQWLVAKWGDVYIHETAISHIRRLLDTDFPCTHLYQTPAQFRRRLTQVENHMNSPQFAAPGKGGLGDLAKDMRKRCLEVIRLRGERIPK